MPLEEHYERFVPPELITAWKRHQLLCWQAVLFLFLLLSAVGMFRTADSSKLHNLHRDNILKTSQVLQSKCYVLAELWSLQEYYSNVRQSCGSVSCQQGIRVAMKRNSPESLWSVFSLRSSFSAASSVKTRRKHSDFSIDIKTSAAAPLWQEE